MRLTIRIDDELMKRLLYITKAKYKQEAISLAVSEFLKEKWKEKLLSLKGKMEIAKDWRELREKELDER